MMFSIFLIFTGAALLATVALYARQSLLMAYILLGAIVGPAGFGMVDDPRLIEDIAHVGIIFLLFLLGLDLYPKKLLQLLKEATLVMMTSTLLFGLLGFGIAAAFGMHRDDCLMVGLATTFSSTIVSLKLLPATVLHHRHTGEVMISSLLLQDLFAIAALLVLHGISGDGLEVDRFALLVLALPLLLLGGLAGERWLLRPLFHKFDKIGEYVFLLTLGWCLGLAQLAQALGLSYEMGAFIAGVTIANSPIAPYIADSLRPLRDFFLIMFFFALGAGLDFSSIGRVWLPALVLATAVVVAKPLVFMGLFRSAGESRALAGEAGVRLGQMSEFSLLLIMVAVQGGLVSLDAATTVQLATIITFVVSAYAVVMRYPTPIALSDRLRRD